MSKKVYGFNLDRAVREDVETKLSLLRSDNTLPPSASASWIVESLLKKWTSGEVKIP